MSGEHGGFTGYGSMFGVMDLGGDVVDRGAFTATLAAFRKAGLILWAHDRARPVAMPIEVREDDFGLWLRCDFHSTPDAQAARSIVAERLAAGFTFGLSIGYRVLGDRYIDGARHLQRVELYEVSLVSMPMLPVATVDTVKGAAFGGPVALKPSAVSTGPKSGRISPATGEALLGLARSAGVPVGPRRVSSTTGAVLLGLAEQNGVRIRG